MPERTTIVAVGASLAGGRAVEALREKGFDGRIVLVGDEPDRPYERPSLSKGILHGKVSAETAFLRSPDFYRDNDIELRLGSRAAALDPGEKTVTLDDGASLWYDKLLVATGCALRRLSVPGSDLPGVRYLRTLADAQTLASDLAEVSRVVVIGAGFVGLEVAASARTLGREVVVLSPGPVPLVRILGESMGRVVADVHRDHGVDLRSGVSVRELRGSGHVEAVVADDGTVIPCDVAVVGIGVTPATGWLAGSGLALDNGILVDELTRTSVPDVFAAGDVASSWNPLLEKRVRLEHYDNAQNQGIAAAGAMLGEAEPYAPVPSFWTDQFDLTLQYVGHAGPEDTLLVRGSPEARSFTAFYLRGGLVAAAFSNRPRDVTAARRLIRNRKRVPPEVLTDEQVDLRAVAK